MTRRLLWSLLAAAAAALLLSAAAGADQAYTDPNGDGKSGTDVVAVSVRNDASGNISIQVQSASPVVANHAIAIFFNADRNQSTGDYGDDYWMYGGPLVGAAFLAWNGTQFVTTNPSGFAAKLVGSNITEFDLPAAALGNVRGFDFLVASISIDPPSVNMWDYAPDNGYWAYDLATAPPPATTPVAPTPTPKPAAVRPVIAEPVLKPARPVAGKPLAVTFAVTRSDTGGALAGGKMACDPSVAGKMIPHAESFKAGVAKLAFTVPKAAKGKLLKVHVAITSAGKTAQRTVTFLVR